MKGEIITKVSEFIKTWTAPNHEGTVVSVSYTAGARAAGIGPVVKYSIDFVTDEAGRGQFYLTKAVGYWGEGLINGNEDVIKLAENMKNLDTPHGRILPQSDSFMTPEAGFSITAGPIDQGAYVVNGEVVPADQVTYHVSNYEGLSRVVEGGAGPVMLSIATGYDPSLGTNGQWTNSTVTSGGYSIGPVPLGIADYTTDSKPIGSEIFLPGGGGPCRMVMLCGK